METTTAAPATGTEVSRTAPFAVHLNGQPFLVEWCEDVFELQANAREGVEGVYLIVVAPHDRYTMWKLSHRAIRYGKHHAVNNPLVLGAITAESNGRWGALRYEGAYQTEILKPWRWSRPKRSRPAAIRALLDMLEGWDA